MIRSVDVTLDLKVVKSPLMSVLGRNDWGPLVLGVPVEESTWRKCSSSPTIEGPWVLGAALPCPLCDIYHTLEQVGVQEKVPTAFPAAVQHPSGYPAVLEAF